MSTGRPLLAAVLALTALAAPAPAGGAGLPLGSRALQERRVPHAVAPGVVWTSIVRYPTTAGPAFRDRWVINVLTVDRRRLAGRLSAVLSNGRIASLETTSSMARRARALAGVNASFYVFGGDPAGALTIDGRLVSEPVDGRTSLLLPRSPAAPATMAALRFQGWVELGGRRRYLDGVDRVRGRIPNCGGRGGDSPTQLPRHVITCTDPSELVVLSPSFASRTLTGPGGVEAVVRRGIVTATREGGNTPIPADGYVLSGSGDAAGFLRAAAQPGARPAVVTDLIAGGAPLDPAGYRAVVSGGPRLLTAGRTTIRSAAEGFQPPADPGLFRSFVAARNPRTLAGITGDGRILLVTVDGRRPGVSVGVTLPEAALLMRALGARDALNLDGGGSTTMTVAGRVVNRPSDGTERVVSDGLFVVP